MKLGIIATLISILIANPAFAQEAPQPTQDAVPDAQKPIEDVPHDQVVVEAPKPVDPAMDTQEVLPPVPLPQTVNAPTSCLQACQAYHTVQECRTLCVGGAEVYPAPPYATHPQSPPLVATREPAYDAHRLRFGFSMDLSIPSGVAVGFVAKPRLDWMQLEAAFTYLTQPGGRLSMQLDPLAAFPKLPIGVIGDLQVGFMGRGSLPVDGNKLPEFGDDYANFFAGLRFGRANSFHWFLEGGETALHFSTSNFDRVIASSGSGIPKGLSIGNPSANVWAAPGFSTGFSVVWP